MLKTYEAISMYDNGLVNETAEARDHTEKRVMPGDIVRRQMFEGDENRHVPIGIVVWVSSPYKAFSLKDCCDMSVLWSNFDRDGSLMAANNDTDSYKFSHFAAA